MIFYSICVSVVASVYATCIKNRGQSITESSSQRISSLKGMMAHVPRVQNNNAGAYGGGAIGHPAINIFAMKTKMKHEKSVILVGDKFQGFSDSHDHIVTLGQLEKMVWEADELPINQIVVGQGVCHRRLSCLQTIMLRRFTTSAPRIINYEQIADQLNPALSKVTHKHHSQNVLISVPVQLTENSYQSKLAIHDATELLGDHMTGQHIQGMVLTEAARQMMLAVAELFMLEPHERSQFYFILNKVWSTYHRFAFPIETGVKLTVIDAARKKGNSLHAEVRVDFTQQDETLAQINILFAAYDKDLISRKEHELAMTRVERLAQEVRAYS